MGTARLSWFLLVSITAHTIFLWQWNLAYLYRHSLRPFKIDLLGSASLQEGASESDTKVRDSGPARPKASQSTTSLTRGPSGRTASATASSAESESVGAAGLPDGILSSPTGGLGVGLEGGSSTSAGGTTGGGQASTGGATTSAAPGSTSAATGKKPTSIQDEIAANRRDSADAHASHSRRCLLRCRYLHSRGRACYGDESLHRR